MMDYLFPTTVPNPVKLITDRTKILKRCPHYGIVPKTLKANLKFREAIYSRGAKSRDLASQYKAMARDDLLFYVNTFCWLLEPRAKPGQPRLLPFITWPFQDGFFLSIQHAIRHGEDLLCQKTRDQGATWCMLIAMDHVWRFEKLASFLLISRKEELVWKRGDPKALFEKLLHNMEYQPAWFRPRIRPGTELMERHLLHPETKSVIDGETSAPDSGTGDRRTAILNDEFALTPDGERVIAAITNVTDCRLFNSTPKGAHTAFYGQIQSGCPTVTLHWSGHPIHSRGMTIGDDGKPSSEWYERMCKRLGHPKLVSQELDIDHLGSDFQFFNQEVLDRIHREDVRRPYIVGEISFDVSYVPDDDLIEPEATAILGRSTFTELPKGRMHLWIHLDAAGDPPRDREYVMGCDIATGSPDATGRGASNSVLAVYDRKTRENVCEVAISNLDSISFAAVALAVGRFFRGKDSKEAFLIHEDNGPGVPFGRRVWVLGYRNVYYRRNERSVARKGSKIMGWWSGPESKTTLLTDFRYALQERTIITRSRSMIDECSHYIWILAGQKVEHSAAANTSDPSGARENHGDRVIANALALKGMDEKKPAATKKAVIIPRNCLAYRIQEAKRIDEMTLSPETY